MQFKAFAPGVEVIGAALEFALAGFRIMPSIALRYFIKHGVIQVKPGETPKIRVDMWYPHDAWLKVFEDIYKEIGPNAMYEVGHKVGGSFPIPPGVGDMRQAMAMLDVGYHMAHRRAGKVLFDPATGTMLEGIGHYRCLPVKNENKIISTCENPYPCDFDTGLVTAYANRFEARARTIHDPTAPCRKTGADSCTIITSW